MEKLKQGLEKMQGDLDTVSASDKFLKKDLDAIKNALRMVGRSERMAEKYGQKLDERLKDILSSLPPAIRQQSQQLEQNLRMALDNILKNTSIFEGKLKQREKELEIDIALLEKVGNDINKMNALAAKITELIKEMIGDVNNIMQWTSSLVSSLEKAGALGKALS